MKTKIIAIATIFISLFACTITFAAGAADFVTTWRVTGPDTITIPVYPTAGLNIGTPDEVAAYTASEFQYNVNCGGGGATNLTDHTGDADCVYTSAGTYTIRISGTFPGIYLDGADDRDKLMTIEQWGTITWRSMFNAFIRASNVTIDASAGVPDLSATTTLRGMFAYNTALTNQDLSGWDTSTITNMNFTFANSTADIDLSGWDVSAVTTADGMFREAGLSTANYDKLLAAWSKQTLQTNVPFGATGVQYCDADARTALIAAGWIPAGDIPCRPTVSNLFGLFIIDTENPIDFDLSDAVFVSERAGDITVTFTAAAGTFTATGTSGVTISGSNTGTLMLTGTPEEINTYLDTASAIQYSGDTRSTVTVTASDGQASVTLGDISMILESDEFVTTWKTTETDETITIPIYPISLVYNYNVDCGMHAVPRYLSGQTGDAVCTYPTVADDHEIRISGTFPAIWLNNTGDKDKIKEIKQWGTGQWRWFASAFYGVSNMTVTATDVPDLSAAEISMDGMFRNALAADPDTTNWDTSNVTDMSYMFSGATQATPTTTTWNTSNVTDMSFMFFGATQAIPNTSGWNTSSVTNMAGMFRDALAADPDTTNWNTSNVTNMNTMFSGASATNPDVSRWNTSSVTNINGMFTDAIAADPDLSGWDVSGGVNVRYIFNNSGLSTTNYDKLLRSWSRQSLQPNLRWGVIPAKYCNTAARAILTDTPNNWTFTDAGVETNSSLCTPHLTMDIDGNGSVQASTDGILIARYIASVRGASLIAGAVAGNASDDRNEADEIVAYLDSLNLDIDGNGGDPGASTDGILIARYIASVRDDALVDGAVAGNAKRTLPGITITLNNLDI